MSLFVHKNKHKHLTTPPEAVKDNRSLYNKDHTKGPPLPTSHWVDGKLMLCVHPSVADYTSTTYDAQVAIPFNTVFDLESLLFKGKAIVRAIDLPSTDLEYFKGRHRKVDFTFQGQFKRKICFDRLYWGQVFDRAFRKLPAQYLIAGAVKIVTALAPSVKGDVVSETPHMISPLASAAQVFQIALPGDEIPLPREPQEDVRLLDEAKFTNMKFTDRKNYFHDLEHLKEYDFVPGYVYTISCYSHMLSPSSYAVHMIGMKWGIAQYLNTAMLIASVVLPEKKQKCESKEEENNEYDFNVGDDGDLSKCEFLFNLQLWHTKLVDDLWPNHKESKSMVS